MVFLDARLLDANAIEAETARDDRDVRMALKSRYRKVRVASLALAEPLSAEDQQAQSMPDASPVKWHLAHVSWFFETLVLVPGLAGYEVFDPTYEYLFNSYYEAVGPRHPRQARGLLTRPSHDEVKAYRAHVDAAMGRLLASPLDRPARDLIALGLAHEEQHQELILMDILSLFAASPIRPAYAAPGARRGPRPASPRTAGVSDFVDLAGGVTPIGAEDRGFAFDNELPRHNVLVQPYRLAKRLVTNGEWLAFMEDGGYRRAEYWLSDGWARVQTEGWQAPLYWERTESGWLTMSLAGLTPIEAGAPVVHISFLEAAAFAAWAGRRLPTEVEWEHAAVTRPQAFDQLFGAVWQWSASAYLPYPGYSPPPGAVGEYNGKFMIGQMVLKGAAHATPGGHSRPSYRNYFHPHQRWAFAGLRLACDPVGGSVTTLLTGRNGRARRVQADASLTGHPAA